MARVVSTKAAMEWAEAQGIVFASNNPLRHQCGVSLACTGAWKDDCAEYVLRESFCIDGISYHWHHSRHHRRGTGMCTSGELWILEAGRTGTRIGTGEDMEALLRKLVRVLCSKHSTKAEIPPKTT